ncbi:sigma-54 dependent transcriptional regulator [uncultured Desulfobacter sp.]|uniref:sigma-54-dependent transcriptional regulator n=1 Tax=uncultured Desulfobacter sp. TaxID=240139 RepID=UPI0029F4B818|nr:sigma-54 dependent transcriptional regulator [uncultured Desulfobacter sp.]
MYPAVLIVDDESTIIDSLEGILSDDGFEVIHAFNGYEALKKIDSHSPDIVLLDIWMPGMDGIDTLKEIKQHHPSLPVVMITGHGSIESAVDATKSGAFDFLEKPLSIDKVILTINNALNFRKLEEENRYLRKKAIEKNSITGTSPSVQKLYGEIMSAAPTDTSILITGENGTGKEMVARTIHQFSKRPEGPFIIINCAAIPEEHLESELFGHEKGAFEGAAAKNRGKFELAAGGTLFLDEIGDMDISTQAKMLRALESKTFQRIGSSRTLHMDVRVITSSNKDLDVEIKEGRFREDLFFRLNVIPIHVPALRERIEDLPLLVDCFLGHLAEKLSAPKKTLSKEAIDILKQWHWKGNVRELKNLMERLSIMVEGDVIGKNEIPAPYNPDIRAVPETGEAPARIFSLEKLDRAKEVFETEFVRFRVDQMNGDLEAAAKLMGKSLDFVKKRMSEN